MKLFVALSALALMPSACEVPQTGESSPKLLGHNFQAVSAATFEVGEDCTRTGPSGCKTQICLHYKEAFDKGYVCSQRCLDTADCPSQFFCQQVLPSSPVRVCTPSPSWQAGVAVARSIQALESWTVDGGPAGAPTDRGPALPLDGGAR